MAISSIHNQASYDAWHDLFNDGDDSQQLKAFELGMQRKLRERINDGSFFLIKEFENDIPSTVLNAEKNRRIAELKSFLTDAVNEGHEDSLEALETKYLSATDELKKDATDSGIVISILQTGDIATPASPTSREKKVKELFYNFFQAYGNRNNEAWYDFIPGLEPEESLEDAVEELAVDGNRTNLDRMRTGFDSTEDDDDTPSIEDNQCLLMSMFYDQQSLVSKSIGYTSTRNIVLNFKPNSRYKKGTLNNMLVSDEKIKTLFETKQKQNHFKKALYLVKDVEYSGSSGIHYKTWEFPLALSTSKLESSTASELAQIDTDILINDGTKNLQSLKARRTDLYNKIAAAGQQENEGMFILDNINIKYDGTNPSTSREDVKVELKFKLESFRSLNTVIGNYKDKIDYDTNTFSDVNITLKELIVRGLGGNQKNGFLTALKNSYSPDNNRLRLKINADDLIDENNRAISTGSPLILDLTIIDHSLTRNAESGTLDLSINYRGYFHSIMTMPFSDVLPSNDVKKRRIQRRENLEKLIQTSSNCKVETLREVLRVERNTFEQENSDARFQELLDFIISTYGVFSAKFDTSQISRKAALDNLPEAGAKRFVKNTFVFASSVNFGKLASNDYTEALKIALSEESVEASVDITQSTWVSLGSIIEAAVRHLYVMYAPVNAPTPMKKHLGSLDLKIALLPIYIPQPATGGTLEIYPAQIPIDIKFFAEWWNENVVKKDLKMYPAGIFIRDLIEKLINNLLFEVCLAHLLPDEAPPRMRCQYMTSRFNFKNIDPMNATRPLDDNGNPRIPMQFCDLGNSLSTWNYRYGPSPPYFTELPSNYTFANKKSMIDTFSYLVIYQQSPPGTRELNATSTTTLKDSSFVPTIVSGLHSKDFSQVKSVSFSKNTAPFLREARYHNNNFGGLALMNNVYDLSFTLTDYHANTYFFPGMIINFIVTDFSGTATVTNVSTVSSGTSITNTLVRISAVSGVTHITPKNYRYTENDPHNQNVTNAGASNTLAYTLGFGGYYIITSVEYDLSSSDAYWSVKITAKFNGTDFDSPIVRDEALTAIEKDKPECIDYYNEAVRLNEAVIQDADPDESTSFQTAAQGVPYAPSAASNITVVSTVPPPTATRITAGSSVARTPVFDAGTELKDFAKNQGSAVPITSYPDGVWIEYYDSGSATIKYKQIPFNSSGIYDESQFAASTEVATKPPGSVYILSYN